MVQRKLTQVASIRPANATDSAFLFQLTPRLAGVPRPPWQTAEAMMEFQRRFMEATLRQPQQGSLTLVAVEGSSDRRLGYVHAHSSRDGVTDEPCGHIAIIVLEAEAEGQGIARSLMAAAETWAREQGWRLLSIDVFADNRRAVEFYQRAGFQMESIRLVKALKEFA